MIIKRQAADLLCAVYDWQGGETLFKQALELDPSNGSIRAWYAYLLLEIGRDQEAMAEMDKALALDRSPLTRWMQGLLLFYARRHDAAVELLTKLAAELPSHQLTRIVLGAAQLNRGEPQKCLAAAEEAKRLAISRDDIYFLAEGLRGCALAAMGRKEDARQVIKDLVSQEPGVWVPPSAIASVHAALGETDEALAHLERGLGTYDRWLRDVRLLPGFDCLRSHPRYLALLKRMNLPE